MHARPTRITSWRLENTLYFGSCHICTRQENFVRAVSSILILNKLLNDRKKIRNKVLIVSFSGYVSGIPSILEKDLAKRGKRYKIQISSTVM